MTIRKRIGLVVAVIVLLVIGIGWYSHRDSGESSTNSERQSGDAVSAMPAVREDFPVYVSALGTVTSLATVNVIPQVEGTLESINVNEGDHVRRGDLIARIDDRTSNASLQQAQGELAQSQAQLSNAQQNLERNRKLLERGAISRQTFDDQRDQVRQYQGTVNAQQAAVRNARASLSYTAITSPVDGIVGVRNIDPGNLVSSGSSSPLLTITQLDPISVVFSLPASYRQQIAARLEQGVVVKVFESGEKQQLAQGRLQSIDSKIDSETNTLRMRARFDNASTALYPDQFVNVQVELARLPNAVVIPETAVQSAQDGSFVYVVGSDSKVQRRKIVERATSAEQVAIESGLEAGDQVVVDGIDRLRDGATVNVVSHHLPGDQQTAQDTQATDSDPS
ncbi:efflux RND transporter periplasmic adaptor subunit [Carnimonas bestiolae]|uniref:efflux RND transporter periplasmic adaptor subunit n=1 Tax=Carnimonas bestiolae TaxID=3402172 RepID=UPI003F4A9A84